MPLALPRKCLVTICKAYFRLHLGYADIMYEKPENEAIKDWFEKIQYNTALEITGSIGGRSWNCIYKELGLESPVVRQWYREIIFFYKIVKILAPKYLQRYLLPQALNVQSCKWYNSKSMTTSAQITNTETFVFMALLVFKLFSRKILYINRKNNRNC